MEPLLKVENLRTVFDVRPAPVVAVNDVSFEIRKGETLGLVGESGSGKSVTAFSLIRLVQDPGQVVGGRVLFQGKDLLALPEDEMRRVRGAGIGFVFQEPMAALNPVMRVGAHIAEALSVHGLASGAAARAQAVELLRDMKREFDLSLLLITHDLGVIAETADRVAVMYAGRIVEQGPVRDIFRNPKHPYTRGLLASIPGGSAGSRLKAIEGTVPNLGHLPPGCSFAPRCSERMAVCDSAFPAVTPIDGTHDVRCYLYSAPGSRLTAPGKVSN